MPTISGYISGALPIKIFKDHKRKYFNFTLINYVTSHRDVCFSLEKYKLFTNVAQEEKSNNDLEVKRFKLGPQNKDIIFTDFSSAKKQNLLSKTTLLHKHFQSTKS